MVSEKLQPTLFVPMTGMAEAEREIRPDPANPAIRNGGFEEVSGDPPVPTGWHYQRQLELVAGKGAQEGKNYITFKNATHGRESQARQGFAVDGRKVAQMQLSAWVRGKDIRPGQNLRPGQSQRQMPDIVIVFYDENRAPVGEVSLAGSRPWSGTFGWQRETKRVKVPPKAREAGICIGLLGAVGEISFDGIEIKPVKK
jgi:protein-L-isoaspartate(D-aspartate) O-methyltransferase